MLPKELIIKSMNRYKSQSTAKKVICEWSHNVFTVCFSGLYFVRLATSVPEASVLVVSLCLLVVAEQFFFFLFVAARKVDL